MVLAEHLDVRVHLEGVVLEELVHNRLESLLYFAGFALRSKRVEENVPLLLPLYQVYLLDFNHYNLRRERFNQNRNQKFEPAC